jgi:hypothetical protein
MISDLRRRIEVSVFNPRSEIINPFGAVNLVNPSRCAFLSPLYFVVEHCDSI